MRCSSRVPFWVLGPTVLAASISPAAWAQALPDAGTLRQQSERELVQPLPEKTPGLPAATPPPPAQAGGVSVTVNAFRFSGNHLLNDAALQAAVAPFVGKPLDLAGLQTAAAAVAQAYRAQGWLARAQLPRQALEQGVVRIEVVEARMGQVVVEGQRITRVPLSLVTEAAQGRQETGQPVKLDALDRGIMLADDLPGVTVSGFLRQGQSEGETDLALKLADEQLLTGEAWADNTGSRSTGSARVAGRLFVNSPFHLGDQASGAAIVTEGSTYLRGALSLPVGAQGARIGVNASTLHYRLIGDFAPLSAKGHSNAVGLEASYPLLRSRQRNLFVSASLDDASFLNEALGAVSSRYGVQSAALGLSGNLFDEIGGGGANAASLSWISSTLDFRQAQSVDTLVQGRSQRLRYSLSRQQAIKGVFDDKLSVYLAYSGQWADKNQDSSTRFYLGGASGVRAYPTNEASGAKGQLFNLELRARLSRDSVLTAFYDWGRVVVNVDGNYLGAPALNAYSLQGAGLALSIALPYNGSLHATWAHRIGSNPNPTRTGRDQDGSLRQNRFWVGMNFPF